MSSSPALSVIVPVLNEERHLRASIDRVLAQHYPGEVEIVLAIGPSKDATHAVAEQLAREHAEITIVDNPSGTTPHALNLAIAAARHDIIVRVDAHGELCEGYLATVVELLESTGAANVGGRMDAHGQTPFEEAVAAAYNSRLGLGGGGFHLADTPDGPADTVFLGAFRRAALEEVGGFDPTLKRAQDWELNYRLRQAGHLVWYSPRLVVTYRPRSTVIALAKQFFRTGQWRREVIRRHPDTASLRYLAPPTALVGVTAGSLAGLAGAASGRRWLRAGWLAPLGYLSIITTGSATMPGLSPAARARLPLVLAVMHLCWGLGFIVGGRRA